MERNREEKRGSLATVNGIGLSRRRQRITARRDSPEEEGQMETVRSRERERVHKVDRVRDRDEELMSQRKRRRMRRCLERIKNRDVEGGGDEDSFGPSGEENYEDDYDEPSSSMSNHASRSPVTPIRNARSVSRSRVADEMIGAAVPRRARSASVKRLNEKWNSIPWGFGERQSRRRLSQLSLGGSVDIASPSSSSVSLRRKMKPLGPKGLIPMVSRKPLPSVEDDIEIEVVEALFDLMNQSQSQSSKKDEKLRANISAENLDLIGCKDFHTKSVCSPTISGQEAPDLPPEIRSTSIASPHGDSDKKELSAKSELNFGKMSSDVLETTEEVSLEKGKDSSEPAQESVRGDQVVVAKEESKSYEKSNSDGSLDSTSKANLASDVVIPEREANFEIDLMASQPMPSSPERDGWKIRMPDPKLDLEKPDHNNSSQQRGPKEPNHCTLSDTERLQNCGQSNSLPSPFVATGCPGSFPPPGFAVPLKTLFPMDKNSRTTALQLAPFTFSQTRLKRCVTHQYIACNIRQHQKLSKNCVLPPATGPATLHEDKPSSSNPTTSTSNSFLGNPSQGDLPGRHASATPPVLSMKSKSSEVANAVDATKCKQLVPQTIENTSAGNLLQPALNFPLGQHQAANVAAQHSGLMGKVALSSNSAGVPVLGSLSLPAGAAAVSFNYANLSTNNAPPFMAILQSNVHPYSTSANSGMPLPIRGAQAPVLPFFNASYHPSIFCTPQNQQKKSSCQPQSKPLYQVQQASSTSGTCSGSTSSYKQSKSHQHIVTQTSSHNYFGSEGLLREQSQKQHILGSHSSIKSVNGPGSQAQKASNGHSYGISVPNKEFCFSAPWGWQPAAAGV